MGVFEQGTGALLLEEETEKHVVGTPVPVAHLAPCSFFLRVVSNKPKAVCFIWASHGLCRSCWASDVFARSGPSQRFRLQGPTAPGTRKGTLVPGPIWFRAEGSVLPSQGRGLLKSVHDFVDTWAVEGWFGVAK